MKAVESFREHQFLKLISEFGGIEVVFSGLPARWLRPVRHGGLRLPSLRRWRLLQLDSVQCETRLPARVMRGRRQLKERSREEFSVHGLCRAFEN
jgi:hypothetical protein